jgi:hypothetical protein
MSSASILYHYKLYQDGLLGLNDTFTMEGSLKDNIFFTPEQIAKQYKLYENNPLRDQVLDGKFVFAGDNIFPADDILAAQDETLDDGIRYEEGHTYVISTDTAIGSDEMVHTVLDTTTTKCYGAWQPDKRTSDNQNKAKPRTSDVKKADLLLSLRKLLSAKEIKLPKNNPKLIQQLSIYREDDRKIPTDRVISLALGAWLATEGSAFLSNKLVFIDL